MKDNKILKVQDIYDFLLTKYPLSLVEPDDKSGLFYVHDDPVTSVYVALEITPKVLQEAKIYGSNLIITHHPLFTNDDITVDKPYYVNESAINFLKENKIAHINLHSNFDKSPDGMNMTIANWLNNINGNGIGIGLANIQQDPNNPYIVTAETKVGIGIEYISRVIKATVRSPMVKYNNKWVNHRVNKLAICAGSSYKFADYVFNDLKVDTFLSGDLKHHDWVDAESKNQNIIDMHHLAENVFVMVVEKELSAIFAENLTIYKALEPMKIRLV
ncbi:Nif3-like dinuclear metal center hexameric protein [Ureaplasma sp. ES3154-GEN]|uniref:Nif3-like dinuclear metal center hexameric protein n=1 Tax=Ureaplasma sp. ES3154-GEN TaxID=2984844 RepID=UPI0021E91961|nr:Nif3-like dinuclear metal center hexameric protein [Ureaplasma sp. ES3154-GEN]MCV3743565.1 Nif3-like dinuclear metal center hexameric protein [Ureaplasma sp. ES3154-GEN]